MQGTANFFRGYEFSEPIGSSYVMWAGIVFVTTLIIFAVLLYRNKGPDIIDYMPTLVSLDKTTIPIGSNEASQILLSGPGATLAGLFNVTIGDKTQQMSTSTTQLFTTLFGIKGSIEFQLAPINISNPDNTAQLLITTNARDSVDATAYAQEIIPLPPLPAQKWIFIAILRDGRRFDVLYNDRFVASHRLLQFPNTGVRNQLVVGEQPKTKTSPARFLGNAKHLFALNYRMTPGDLAALRAKYVDTTGAPPTPLPFPSPIDFISLQTFCIPGLPCQPVNKPPPNALQAWSSPYA